MELNALLTRAKELARRALERGDLNVARHFLELAEEAARLSVETKQLASELTKPSPASPSPNVVAGSSAAPTLSRKAAGKKAVQDFVRATTRFGMQLVPTGRGGRTYQTRSGRLVQVAYASEVDGRPDRWFLGLPDRKSDIVVLLCKERSGGCRYVVLPPHFVVRIWPRLTRSNGQVKFHVIRYGTSYELLLPGKQREPITQYVDDNAPLR